MGCDGPSDVVADIEAAMALIARSPRRPPGLVVAPWQLQRELAAAGAPCCDLHGRACEPPSELCCDDCTEGAHPAHADGSVCAAPDLSGFRP